MDEKEQDKIGELAYYESLLRDSDYIVLKMIEEIISLKSPLTFVTDFISILAKYSKEYKKNLADRETWRKKVKELKGE